MESEKPTETPTIAFKGSCACKRMTYDCTHLPHKVTACHCITCRKLSGGPFQAFADVPPRSVTFYDNREHLRYEGLPKDDFGGITFLRLSKVADRAFCASCNTPLAMRYAHEGGDFDLAIGSADEASLTSEEAKAVFKPKQHIFVSQRVWWYDIAKDGTPFYDRFPGTFEDDMKAGDSKEG
ncbi:hypothetical protein LTR85_000284 [Meristemomyces frigidus]|nr:hypothetical protein LTR85_000284 [Meristemomyces frigidus]